MKFFTYGSLKKGEYNHKILKDSKFLGKTSILEYTLYDKGSYPVAILTGKEGDFIEGEVYEIDTHTWSIIYNMERYAGYKESIYKDLHFFEYRDWLRAVTKYKYIGSTWNSKK